MILSKNILANAVISASLVALPVVANASLTIINNTNLDSTSVINNTCSTALGTQGITRKHTTNVVSDLAINLACGFTPNNCIADLRMTADCTGPSMGTIVFDISSGIKGATLTQAGIDAGYRFSGQSFSIQLDGGPG